MITVLLSLMLSLLMECITAVDDDVAGAAVVSGAVAYSTEVAVAVGIFDDDAGIVNNVVVASNCALGMVVDVYQSRAVCTIITAVVVRWL